jgi:hypothetical protein
MSQPAIMEKVELPVADETRMAAYVAPALEFLRS